MRRYLLLILAVGFVAQGARGQITADLGQRTVDLGRDWKFFTQEVTGVDNLPLINLPHTWSRDALFGRADYYRGVGTYVKRFDVPAEWSGRRVTLELDGTSPSADIFVNGRFAGHHTGGWVPFAMDITGLLQPGGNNFIWVSVDNSVRLDVLPTALDATYYGFLRGARLLIRDRVSIRGGALSPEVKVVTRSVSAEKVTGEVQIGLTGDADKNVTAYLTVISRSRDTVDAGRVHPKVAPAPALSSAPALGSTPASTATLATAAPGRSVIATIPFTINKPSLWSGREDPYLYDVNITIVDGDGRLCDSLSLRTGFRTITYDPSQGLLLNGKPYPVRGVKVRQDRAGVGPAVSEAQVREDVATALDMGANAIRVVGVPHHPSFYAMCDREGILVWSDLPLQGSNFFTDKQFIPSESFMSDCFAQSREIIDRQWNNPSVVMWGIFSNLNLRGDSPVTFVREFNRMVKGYDPSRLTVASSNQDGDINFITDLIVWDQSLGWKEGQPGDIMLWLSQLRSSWSALPSGISYGAGGSIAQQEQSPSRPDRAGNWHPEQWQTFFHTEYLPRLRGAALWGTFVDLFDWGWAAYNAGQSEGVCDMGLVTFDRRDRKDAYYLYKANWNPADPFIWLADKRLIQRTTPEQTVRAFTNRPEAELLLNDVSQGVVPVADGIASWNVQLPSGASTLEVRSGELSDHGEVVLQ